MTLLLLYIIRFYHVVIQEFTALGINFPNSLRCVNTSKKNYFDKLVGALENINLRKTRDLTLYGRITIINSLLMSQFVCTWSSLLFAQVEKSSMKLIDWHFQLPLEGMTASIKTDIITKNKNCGGLNTFYPTDFIKSLKFKLLQKILDNCFTHSRFSVSNFFYSCTPLCRWRINHSNQILIFNRYWVLLQAGMTLE